MARHRPAHGRLDAGPRVLTAQPLPLGCGANAQPSGAGTDAGLTGQSRSCRIVSHELQEFEFLFFGWLEQLGALENQDAARAAAGAATRERHRRRMLVAEVDEFASFWRFDRQSRQVDGFEHNGGHVGAGRY